MRSLVAPAAAPAPWVYLRSYRVGSQQRVLMAGAQGSQATGTKVVQSRGQQYIPRGLWLGHGFSKGRGLVYPLEHLQSPGSGRFRGERGAQGSWYHGSHTLEL